MPKGEWRLVHEKRQLCPARAHDTNYAFKRYKCRCPKAREDYQLTRGIYMAVNREEINRRSRERMRDKIRRQQGREPYKQGGPGYEDMMDAADWMVAEHIVKNGPMTSARVYDRWLALDILLTKQEKLPREDHLTQAELGFRVGLSERTVSRFVRWRKSQAEREAPKSDSGSSASDS